MVSFKHQLLQLPKQNPHAHVLLTVMSHRRLDRRYLSTDHDAFNGQQRCHIVQLRVRKGDRPGG
jgi:hypothetical protein